MKGVYQAANRSFCESNKNEGCLFIRQSVIFFVCYNINYKHDVCWFIINIPFSFNKLMNQSWAMDSDMTMLNCSKVIVLGVEYNTFKDTKCQLSEFITENKCFVPGLICTIVLLLITLILHIKNLCVICEVTEFWGQQFNAFYMYPQSLIHYTHFTYNLWRKKYVFVQSFKYFKAHWELES